MGHVLHCSSLTTHMHVADASAGLCSQPAIDDLRAEFEFHGNKVFARWDLVKCAPPKFRRGPWAQPAADWQPFDLAISLAS